MNIEELFFRYKRVVLMYSGGKDSLACLLLTRPFWDRLNVVWVDTGNQFPEVREHMEIVRRLVPHLTVIKSDTPAFWRENGFPVDVVPTRHTAVGHYIYGETPIRVCSRFDCCMANIWKPMADYFRLTKPDCVIRGDRGQERAKGLQGADGIAFEFPIFDWTTEKVMRFIRDAPDGLYQPRHELPEGSSLDCMTCMAYNSEHASRMAYLKKHHPDLYGQTRKFFRDYSKAVVEELMELSEE